MGNIDDAQRCTSFKLQSLREQKLSGSRQPHQLQQNKSDFDKFSATRFMIKTPLDLDGIASS
jgi:hypothetical protein